MLKAGPEAMTQEEYLLLNEFIAGDIGLAFPEHKRDLLESRLRPRLQALRLRRYIEYYFLLQADDGAERRSLAELVTNNETYFFRETQQFDALFEHALPRLRAGAPEPARLRLLSAGCSSGEEAYTLAIAARQHFVELAGTKLTIDAFDVDRGRIETARRGQFAGTSFRVTTPQQVARWFLPTGDGRWAVKPFLQAGLRFSTGNILDLETFAAPAPYDALFCRNVLIYFSEPALHRAVLNFASVLRPGGLLFLGHSESIIGMSKRFETLRLGATIAYRKVGD